ncbi:MAG: TetR/AcrR family transcriptional regulator [Nitrospira sp.]|nr:TetR/AcrR family transcriptional regulator [Nitrospira sp.]MCP9475478.1 TetR/AcrR family transcriptional regulator [Nitrospira sp.]
MATDHPAVEGLSARDRILRTVHDLFYRDGIRATGIDRVIAEAGVTKMTFYRHFPSKNDLIMAYLEHRHRLWMNWLAVALERHRRRGRRVEKRLVAVFQEWFESEEFRGCAFLNAVVEMAGVLPEVADIAKRHKDAVAEVIAPLLPESPDRQDRAQAIVVVLDGAILRAQRERAAESALAALDTTLRALLKG